MSSGLFQVRAFTLVELMIIITIVGILVVALVPSYSSYIQRGRDTSRVSDVDSISKSLTLYYTENETFPAHDGAGCVNSALLLQYNDGKAEVDPQPTHYNGCTLGQYGYGMSTGLTVNPFVYSILAVMEQPYGGNYSGGISGFTGVLSASAYNSGVTLTRRGNGIIYVRVP